ncbi:hypothetical protein Nepgr_002334 [Nepenthes gracilis]|uniref:RING-type domain-containing protein n=1 Tax=Nepenthes gracilis TaxID=150966 RepID=A0AAD3P3P5_NEPGR|nr:hypothetical protein Nepgr_002334 [Nepenthes gracilis]
MGFPVGYTELCLPKLLIYALSFLGFLRSLISSLFRFLRLTDFLEPPDDVDILVERPTGRLDEFPPLSEELVRELLPVMQFTDAVASTQGLLGGDGVAPENCAVCLYEFEGGQEVRWLSNCKHIFHRSCLDRWMDHDRTTCPLCRTPFLCDDLLGDVQQRFLDPASAVSDEHCPSYGSITH